MKQNIPSRILNLWDQKQRLAITSVPDALNPFARKGVSISAVFAPMYNIKFLTVLGLLCGAKERGLLQGVNTLVESTSGNTGLYLAMLAPLFGIENVTLIIRDDLPEGKRAPLRVAGATPEFPTKGTTGIAMARSLGGGGWIGGNIKANGAVLNLDQYGNTDSTYFHRTWLGPKIIEQLGELTLFSTAIGTGGTIIGLSEYFRSRCEKISIIGALCAPKNEAPGARDLSQMSEINLPWRAAIDAYVEVETRPAYLAALWFHRLMFLPAGPTGGLGFGAILRALASAEQSSNGLDAFRNKDGKVRAAFLVPDASSPYGDRFMANLHGDFLERGTDPPFPHELLL